MCLILFSYQQHPDYKLVIAANRDEFYDRPTEEAGYWEDEPNILAGRDIEAGGTWMGMNHHGKIAMLTNFRDPYNIKTDAPSRGKLVSDFLKKDLKTEAYLQAIADEGMKYNGFNLICGNPDQLYYYGNYQQGVHPVPAGIHGLSNALLDTQWPKVDKGKVKLETALNANRLDMEVLFDLLYDNQMAPENELPDTGIGLDKEKVLSSIFIKSPRYGSRCSTVIAVDKNNHVRFAERTYDLKDFTFTEKQFEFRF
ncbi:NRDE family protein [Fulvivirga sp. M361]|uniref:NRDE family protein n=1 Tax=Fulvivirga sp. M361 TaxID=2594266 RepID=UPI00117A067F|nr:NRDE family protein [Fulvivirga sp. M361]TRX57705.1 NRDE family protein [Fulvivirga sp. M361]